MKVTLYLDEQAHRYMNELPRKVSASKIARYILKALFTTDDEWREILRTDKDAREVKEYVRSKLLERLQ